MDNDKTTEDNNAAAQKGWALARRYPKAESFEDAVKLDAAFAKWEAEIKDSRATPTTEQSSAVG